MFLFVSEKEKEKDEKATDGQNLYGENMMDIDQETYQSIFLDLCKLTKINEFFKDPVKRPYGTYSVCTKSYLCCYTADEILLSEQEAFFKWDYPYYLVDFDVPKCDRLVLKNIITFDDRKVVEGMLFCSNCRTPMLSYVSDTPGPIDCAYFVCLECFTKTKKLDIIVSCIPELLLGGIFVDSLFDYIMKSNTESKKHMERDEDE